MEQQNHKRVIIHIDFDYFYAQVEEILNPSLKTHPLGVQQGRHIVTCNYEARKFGVEKWKLISECLEKCPQLKIVPGEDLQNYKLFSTKVTKLLIDMFGCEIIEKLGLDEHYIDVSKIIDKQLLNMSTDSLHFEGPLLPNEEYFDLCQCGCISRMKLGSQLANEIRIKIFEEIGLTCSAGIAHNKLLAKLAGNVNKPNSQTCLAPMYANDFMIGLQNVCKITGIGGKISLKLENVNIRSISDLQNCEMGTLQKVFGSDMALRLKQLASGIDESLIKPIEKPKSISFENSFRPISTKSLSIRNDAAAKFQGLLSRLLLQIQDDCRIPTTLKITLRKYDSIKKSSTRESRQCGFPSNCFKVVAGKLTLNEGAEDKIMKNILCLFDRMIDLKQSFSITLIGLCFNKFQKGSEPGSSGTMAKFLMKKQDIEVQSITNISNDIFSSSDTSNFRTKTASPSSSIMDFETISNNSLEVSGSEDDNNLIEPSPKKRKKLNLCIPKTNSHISKMDEVVSPTKLSVSNLRLNGGSPNYRSNESMELPSHVDASVWQDLPPSIKRELILNWQKNAVAGRTKEETSNVELIGNSSKLTKIKSNNNNTLHKYFLKNS